MPRGKKRVMNHSYRRTVLATLLCVAMLHGTALAQRGPVSRPGPGGFPPGPGGPPQEFSAPGHAGPHGPPPPPWAHYNAQHESCPVYKANIAKVGMLGPQRLDAGLAFAQGVRALGEAPAGMADGGRDSWGTVVIHGLHRLLP